MTAIKARKCFAARSPSDWVARVFLTCDNMIAVQFRHGQKVKKVLDHGPGAYLGHGGVPAVCCLYPGTQGERAVTLYQLAQAWPFAGEWVHAFLYKKFGYKLVSPPPMCGDCLTSCSLSASPSAPTAGQDATISCTVTNTDGSTSKGAAPQGNVAFSVDGTSIGTVALPDTNPAEQNYETVSTTWTATSGTHTIGASYTPSDGEFASASATLNLTVSSSGIQTSCCPATVPTNLTATITNGGALNGSYALTYSTSEEKWLYDQTFGSCGGGLDANTIVLSCNSFTEAWQLNTAASLTLYSPSSASCSPFQLVFTGISLSQCGGGGSATITITV